MKADTLRGQQSRGHRTGPGVPQGPPVASSGCEGLLRWPEHRSFLRQMRSRGRERRQRSASLPPGARKAATWGPWTGLERPSAHVDLPSVSTSEGPWGALPSELAPDLPAPPRPTSITCTAEPGGRPPTPSAGTPELLPMSPALTAQPRGLGSPRSAGFSVTPPYSSLPRRTFRFILLLKLTLAPGLKLSRWRQCGPTMSPQSRLQRPGSPGRDPTPGPRVMSSRDAALWPGGCWGQKQRSELSLGLEARRPRPRCRQGRAALEALVGGGVLGSLPGWTVRSGLWGHAPAPPRVPPFADVLLEGHQSQ